MMRKGTRFFCGALAVLMLVPTGCSLFPQQNNSITADAVSVWTAPATEKILQERTDLYGDLRNNDSISLYMAKNEYESGQVILTAKEDIPYYNVIVSDLVMKGTENKIESENISIYNEKYTSVNIVYDTYNNPPAGMYPDAILPFDTAKKFGENCVKKGQNQGIYITFKTDVEQPAGLYEGNVIVDFKGFNTSVPVKIQVADVTVSEERHAKNIFLAEWRSAGAELEDTEAKDDAYIEMLFRYRLSPNRILQDTKHSPEDIEYYIEKAYDLMQDVRCSNITVPYVLTSYQGQTCFDADLMETYLRGFAEKSFETGFNMYDKLVCYFSFLDELRDTEADLARMKVVGTVYKELLEALALEYEQDESITAENKADVVEGIRNLRNVCTFEYRERWIDYVDTWCPTLHKYEGEKKEQYDEQEEKWWYTCNSPVAPYPTYHIEDTLLSARAMSWMQAEYNVVGNLYWAVDYYMVYNGSSSKDMEDYYGTAVSYPRVNGEGFLFYPGGQYELDLPVASLRLEAIRDGLEEYELLYALKERYKALSETSGYPFNADEIVSSLGDMLYNDLKVSTTHDKLLSAREQLFALLSSADSDAGMCIVGIDDDSYGNMQMKVFVKDGYDLKENGEIVTTAQVESVTGGKVYTLNKTLNQDRNEFNLSVDVDGKTYSYMKYAGGKVSTILADNLTSAVVAEDVTPQVELVNASVVGPIPGNLLKISMPASGENMQSVRIAHSFLENIGANSNKMVLHIYNPSSEEVTLTVSAAYKYSKLYSDLTSVTLKRGLNVVEVSLKGVNWAAVGSIKHFALYINSDFDQPARTIYLQDMVLYNN